mmetsp:Transcript_30912/g.80872  ORF Transcript_30912/g.80872 Transcript_30912/m.80872 type:complete len:361 (-) Transcript_30912:1075-2157(-)
MDIASGDAVMVGPVDLKPHYQAILKAAVNLDFDTVEGEVTKFWGAVSKDVREKLCDAAVIEAQIQADTGFYETLIHQLIPDIFAEIETKKFRTFAKGIEHFMADAVNGFPEAFAAAKQKCAVQFGQRLRRYTGLNHLMQAAKAVLGNPEHVAQMQQDYQKVDAAAAQEQLLNICGGGSGEKIAEHEARFRRLHSATNATLVSWAHWLQCIVESCMGPYVSDEQFAQAGSDVLLRWSFISSLIIRDLTLRSAASFGPFHLLRLLCDEYVFYLVEAARCRRTPRPFELHNIPELSFPPEPIPPVVAVAAPALAPEAVAMITEGGGGGGAAEAMVDAMAADGSLKRGISPDEVSSAKRIKAEA